MVGLTIPEIKWRTLGQKDQRGVILIAFHAVVDPAQRVFKVMGDGLVKRLVLVLGNVRLGARPQRRRCVHGFPLIGGLAVIVGLAHAYRQGDVIGIALDDMPQAHGFEELVLILAQMEHDLGSTWPVVDLRQRIAPFPIRGPAHRSLTPGATRVDRDAIRHDECRVKAHTKLPDQPGVLLFVTGQLLHELACAGAGNGPKVLNDLIARHANAVVANRHGPLILIGFDLDPQLGIICQQAVVLEGFVAQLVGGVRSIGDQLPEEDLRIGIQRVDHQVKQLLHLSLKFE